MSKNAEKDYLQNTGDSGRIHNLGKPFSDGGCGVNLAAIGTIISLLPPSPARILDMGCGAGWTSIFFAKHGHEVVGVDISQDMIDLALENKSRQNVGDNLSFVSSDYESLNLEEQFDAVVFFDCLHHAEDERLAIDSAYRALKKGGVLVTHEPGEGHANAPWSIAAMELYGVTEKDMPPHLIIKHGTEAGFSLKRIYPMQHDLIELFYKQEIPSLFSKRGFLYARRVLRAAFRPSDRAGSIVMMSK